MAKVWKVLALLLVITALVWLTTLWRWQSAHVDPSSTDLVLHLALLPIALTAALLGMLWAVKRLRGYAAAPTVLPPPARAKVNPTAGEAQAEPATRSTSVRVLAANAQLRAGSDWQEALAKIAGGDCKIELDPDIKDDDGIAVFTAPTDDLSTDNVAQVLDEIVAARVKSSPQDWSSFTPSTELLRALTLIESTIAPMLDTIEMQWPALAVPLPSARGSTPANAPALPPTVQIRVCLPARWSALTQQAAQAWLDQYFEPHLDAALKAAGQSRAMASAARAAAQLHVHPIETAEAGWLLLEQQLQLWHREQQPGLLWMVVADSLLSEDTVNEWASTNTLFSGRNQQGRVPGEGAASLLLATTQWPSPSEAAPPLAILHRASLARRDKSADASGRITPQSLMQAVNDTLKGCGIEATQIKHLTTDADHRASRTAEVYQTAMELMPELDTEEQALRLGLGCGDVGVSRLLACAALSAKQAESCSAPGLVLGTFSPFERLAVLIAPVQPTPDAPAAASARAA